jgi:hypothetical protein
MGSLEATHRQRSVSRFSSRHALPGDREGSVCWRVLTDCKFAGSRDHLPTISFFTKDGSGYPSRNSTISSPTPLVSPTTMFPSQPSPYSYQPSATSAPPQPGYISPPDSRRAPEEEKEKQLQPQRQSLPSIHEALRNDSPLPYPAPPTSGPPPQAHPAPPHALVGRSAGDGPAGPPNPFSNGAPAGPYMREPAYSQLQTEASRSSLASITTQESRNPSLQSLNSSKSPTHSAKTGLTSITGSQTGSGYEYSAPTSAGSIASPNGYTAYSQPFTFQSQPPPNAPTYPLAHHDTRPYAATPWKPGAPEPPRVEELKNGLAGRPAVPVQPQGDSAKRHLDIYEVETSLNEVCVFIATNMFIGVVS